MNQQVCQMTISIPWFYPQVGEREQERVAAVVASNYINDGGVAREFEARIAELVGGRHCVAVTSGAVGIALALIGLGVGPGDGGVVPDPAFIATAHPGRPARAR